MRQGISGAFTVSLSRGCFFFFLGLVYRDGCVQLFVWMMLFRVCVFLEVVEGYVLVGDRRTGSRGVCLRIVEVDHCAAAVWNDTMGLS